MQVKTTLLGTGTSQGVPIIGSTHPVCLSHDPRDKRLRSSVHFDVDGVSLVVDTGPDFRQQMLRAGIEKIDAVLYTHEHRDHTAGFDDIRPYNFMQGGDLKAYALPRVKKQLQQDYAYAFEENKYPGAPGMEICEIDQNKPFTVEGIEVIPLPAMHYKLPVIGFRVGNTAYLTDTNYIPTETLNKLNGVEVLILDALRREKHISHFTISEAVEVAEHIGANETYFTHISHLMGFQEDVNRELPDGMELGYDSLVLTSS